MKSFFIAAALLTTLSVKAQSYLVQESGKLLTIDKQGFVYDLQQNVVPKDIKRQGKTWFIDKEGMTVISANGLVNKKVGLVLPKSIKESGGSWLIGDKAELVIVKSDGIVLSYTEASLTKAKILFTGNNWFVMRAQDKSIKIVTLDLNDGRYYVGEQANMQSRFRLNLENIRFNGNNWFTDSNGTLYVVRTDGGVMSKKEMGVFLGLNSHGGNFFIDVRGGVNVVLDNGFIILPYLPLTFGNLIKTGATIAWNTQGDSFTFAEAPMAADANFQGNEAALTRVQKFAIKQPLEPIDMHSLIEEN